MKTCHARLKTPFAVLGIVTTDRAVTGIDFLPLNTPELAPRTPLAAEACRQLQAYLSDPSFSFDLPLETGGTEFQRRAWRAMQAIPPGRAKSYGELAEELHSAPRAVGQACGANPLPVVIPCHRVVAKAGLGGFAHAVSGDFLDYKRWLLDHEGYRPGAA
jgi:O-6-methylguanine DNA methyltransferase